MASRKQEPIDAFTRSRFASDKIGERWRALQRHHQQTSQFLLAGLISSTFSDDEIDVLRRFGLLSPNDESLIDCARSGKFYGHCTLDIGRSQDEVKFS